MDQRRLAPAGPPASVAMGGIADAGVCRCPRLVTAYFDPSTLVKQTKQTTTTLLTKLPRMKKLFADFLRVQTYEKYLHTSFGGAGGLVL